MINLKLMLKKFKLMMANSENLVGMNARNLELIYPNNKRPNYPLADDKLLCKEWLIQNKVPSTELILKVDSMAQISQAISKLDPKIGLAIKPSKGSGGQGIQLAFPGAETWKSSKGDPITREDLELHVKQILSGHYSVETHQETALIERLVYPNAELLPKLVKLCDLRVIAHQGNVIAAMLRVPTKQSQGKANLHQGGIGIGIELKTGKTHQAVSLGQSIELHPDSQEELLGVPIPNWELIMQESKRLAQECPLKYIGIDWALSNEGPLVLELNTRPGLEIQNANRMGLRKSLSAVS